MWTPHFHMWTKILLWKVIFHMSKKKNSKAKFSFSHFNYICDVFFPPHVNWNFHMWKQNTWNLLLHMWIPHFNTFYFNITTNVFHMWTWSFHGCFGFFQIRMKKFTFKVWLAFSTCENKTWHIKSCEICFITCEFHIFTCIWLFFPCETNFFC